jgi:hypothetical protein
MVLDSCVVLACGIGPKRLRVTTSSTRRDPIRISMTRSLYRLCRSCLQLITPGFVCSSPVRTGNYNPTPARNYETHMIDHRPVPPWHHRWARPRLVHTTVASWKEFKSSATTSQSVTFGLFNLKADTEPLVIAGICKAYLFVSQNCTV